MEKSDLLMPEYIKVADIITWRTHSAAFILFSF
jgi:hypothetical protein